MRSRNLVPELKFGENEKRSMHYNNQTVFDLLKKLRTRRRLLICLRGVAICLAVIALVLVLTGWSAHRYRYNDSALIALRIGALLTVLATIFFALVYPLWKKISDERLARLIEERTPGIDDRLVTAVEYSQPEQQRNISPAIINRMFTDAGETSATLDLGRVVRTPP